MSKARDDLVNLISDLKNLRKRSLKLKTLSSKADSKKTEETLPRLGPLQTVSHLGQKKKLQPTKNPKDELLERCPARGIPAENKQPRYHFPPNPRPDPDLRVPVLEAFWVPSIEYPVSALGTASCSKKWKITDKENLPFFRIWSTSIYSNRQEPTYRRLYKGNPNPRIGDRLFWT
ncbi:hypothetical protein F2Q70_00030017 [Brassica cretica]|uniref:MBD domain-containing protein n=2 Tax=Brassica cretica TaxID=69181 RepID=A0A8S9H736_BRACR|nr:hypothetical protein F2Q70_00030017 [Brassica cretica]KAF2552900.1 hypothetical protein F2Q68_00034493 [Brassica cretica]KAF3485851.1 hypothetical protein F2Q69_00053282 [Brassica cretica]KAF3593669.1 hypothetical protein DY000_02022312 [Brassica cretica]